MLWASICSSCPKDRIQSSSLPCTFCGWKWSWFLKVSKVMGSRLTTPGTVGTVCTGCLCTCSKLLLFYLYTWSSVEGNSCLGCFRGRLFTLFRLFSGCSSFSRMRLSFCSGWDRLGPEWLRWSVVVSLDSACSTLSLGSRVCLCKMSF